MYTPSRFAGWRTESLRKEKKCTRSAAEQMSLDIERVLPLFHALPHTCSAGVWKTNTTVTPPQKRINSVHTVYYLLFDNNKLNIILAAAGVGEEEDEIVLLMNK